MKTSHENEVITTALANELLKEVRELKSILKEKQELNISPDWIPWKRVMEFFDYGDTQMAAMETTYNLVTTKIGRRKFMNRKSIDRLLQQSANQAVIS